MLDYKTYSERSSSTILDLFGDIGGFSDFIATFFSLIGSSFAARALLAAYSETLYLRKKSKEELRQQGLDCGLDEVESSPTEDINEGGSSEQELQSNNSNS